MAVVTLLANALRGTTPTPAPTFNVPGGSPAHVRIAMTSPTFGTDPTLTWDLAINESPDGVQPFQPWYAIHGVGGSAGTSSWKGVLSDGLARETFYYDGVARTVQIVATAPTPFVWGLTAEVLP